LSSLGLAARRSGSDFLPLRLVTLHERSDATFTNYYFVIGVYKTLKPSFIIIMSMTCAGTWIKICLVCSIATATVANIFLIESNAKLTGLWGLIMQFFYSQLLEDLPFINVKSRRFLGICGS
jgi:hypothetical protein